MITIDFRERDLIDLSKEQGVFDTDVTTDSKMVNGDLSLSAPNKNNELSPILILERKKISDFQASLRDGRCFIERLLIFDPYAS